MKVEGRLFVPKAVTRIRSVLTVIEYGHSDLIYDSVLWRGALENVESAILQARVSHLSVPSHDDLIYRDASRGGTDGIEAVLSRLVIDSGHAELTDVPLAFSGWSAAAGFGAAFAVQHSDRTLAFIRYHTHRRTGGLCCGRTVEWSFVLPFSLTRLPAKPSPRRDNAVIHRTLRNGSMRGLSKNM